MKSIIRTVDDHGLIYDALMFVCPACALKEEYSTGLHMLPVNSNEKNPSWDWNGDLTYPTISPSILTRDNGDFVCHSFLVDGVFQFLPDCTHPLVNLHVEIPDLPEWVIEEQKAS